MANDADAAPHQRDVRQRDHGEEERARHPVERRRFVTVVRRVTVWRNAAR